MGNGMHVVRISASGRRLALRPTTRMAKTAGFSAGSRFRVTVCPGCIVIELETRPALSQMLAVFDPTKHAGEVMVDGAAGVEAFDKIDK